MDGYGRNCIYLFLVSKHLLSSLFIAIGMDGQTRICNEGNSPPLPLSFGWFVMMNCIYLHYASVSMSFYL